MLQCICTNSFLNTNEDFKKQDGMIVYGHNPVIQIDAEKIKEFKKT